MAGSEALPFGEFFAVLRARGYSITLEHHLRLARLLERTGPSLAPANLRGLLCPIFATDASEQEAFYAAFDSYFAALLAPPSPTPAGESAVPETPKAVISSKRRWLGYAIAAFLALAAASAIVWLRSPPPTVEQSTPRATPSPSTPDPVAGGEISRQQERPQLVPTPPPLMPAPPARVPFGERSAGFLQQHRIELKCAVVSLVVIGFSFGEWRRWRRRELLIARARRRKPPFSWPVRVGAPKIREFHSQPLYDAARAMRRRQAADTEHLDLLGSLQATIRGGGLPRLVYRRGSRVPEYLFLIDCASPRDHQAAFFDQLAASLERESVFIARYFYRGDPRICWDDRATTSLADLRRLHADHRLLLIGDGAGLLDPLTGDPASWLPLLFEWREHALLTPVPSARWGLREATLGTLLQVLPATVEALADVPELLERGSVESSRRTWQDEAPVPPRAGRAVSLEALRGYLGDSAFEWLCASAIYPELQWNLTLFLAAQSPQAGELLNENVLLRLTRLPWFREGVLPDELRARLLAVLPDERQLRYRRALIEILESNPPPRESHAADAREIDIAIHRKWIGRHDRALQEKTPAAATLPLGEQTRDYSELRLHEPSAATGLAFLLPAQVRALVYDKALAPLGIRPILRLVMAILVAGAGVTLTDRMSQESQPSDQRWLAPELRPTPSPTPAPPLPYAKAVPGKPGYVTSPYDPKAYIDVRGFPPETEVKDPYSGKMFRVPPVSTPASTPPASAETPDFGADPFKTAAADPTATVLVLPKPPSPTVGTLSSPEPSALFNDVIARGKSLRESGDMSTALTRFREALAMEPKSAEASFELAVTYEKMQVPEKAAEQWRRIYEMGESAGPYFTAAEVRLKQIQQDVIKSLAASTGETEEGIAPGKTLGLINVVTEDRDDRTVAKHLILRIPINVRARTKVDVRDLTIQVLFYDLVDNQNVVQTAATMSSRWATAPANWLDSNTETLEVDYQLPLPDARAAGRENRRYFGYLVRIYYKGELQAVAGEPEKLVQQFPPEQKLPGSAAQNPPPTNQPAPAGTPIPQGSSRGGSGPYQTSADFEKYARMLREKALLKLEPQVVVPTGNRPLKQSKYPWKNNIVTTVFSVGSTAKGKPARNASAWDPKWLKSFGGLDNPDPAARRGFIPSAFVPQQNPFYIALPYNDVIRGTTKPEAKAIIPWFNEAFQEEGKSVCRDRWIRIRSREGKDCYAQWSDCGPSGTDHWQYVFGDERPKPSVKQGAGLEISPAVRDYLGVSGPDVIDWQFVDVKDIPRGPWSMYGENNDFVQMARRNPIRSQRLEPPLPTKAGMSEPTVIVR